LIDVVPLTLGVETFGGGVDKIIHRNTPIPIVERREYTTYQDNQAGVKFHVVQGERPLASECRSLANFELVGIPPTPAGMPRLIVEFSVDVNGLLNVKAVEKNTSIQQEIVVDPSSGLAAEEMESILRKAMENQREDSLRAKNIVLKVESERMLKFWKSIVEEVPEDSREIARDEIARLEKALQAEHYQEITSSRKKLENIFSKFLDDIINANLSGKNLGELERRKKL
jgi:molecular chaperone HscA